MMLNEKLTVDNVIEKYVEIIKAREQHTMNLVFRENRIRIGKPIDMVEMDDILARQHDLMEGLVKYDENGDLIDLENICPTVEIGETTPT